MYHKLNYSAQNEKKLATTKEYFCYKIDNVAVYLSGV